MRFELSTSYNLCDSKENFNNLITNYPELKKYDTEYYAENKKTLVTIKNDETLQFIKEIDEDVFI